jgi:acetyltransferase
MSSTVPAAGGQETRRARSLRIRRLRPSDRPKYERAVAALSPRSRYLRFGAPLHRMSPRHLEEMMAQDGDRHVAYVALTPDEAAVVGVARYVRSAEDSPSGEVAIAVADDWQGQGVGRRLLERVVEHARLAGLDSLSALILSENRAAAGLARATGFSVTGRAGTYTEHELRLSSLPRTRRRGENSRTRMSSAARTHAA